jgi:hypothetical protein
MALGLACNDGIGGQAGNDGIGGQAGRRATTESAGRPVTSSVGRRACQPSHCYQRAVRNEVIAGAVAGYPAQHLGAERASALELAQNADAGS